MPRAKASKTQKQPAPEEKGRRAVAGFSKVTSKGQITISAGLRKAIGLNPGDRVVITRQHDGSLKLQRMMTIDELMQSLPLAKVPPIDWKAAREEMAEEIAEKVFREIAEANERRRASDALP